MSREAPDRLAELILYVLSEVTDLGGYTTTIRLYKFLYLIDLEYWRRHGRTLSGIEWQFHHYGPFSPAVRDVASQLSLDVETEEFRTADGYEGRLLTAPYYHGELNGFTFSEKVMIDGLLKVWADQNTPGMLDYVYSTEPVRFGTRYVSLDWSRVEKGTRYVRPYVNISDEITSGLRHSVSTYGVDDTLEPIDTKAPDESFLQALNDLEDTDPTVSMADTGFFPSTEMLLYLFPPDDD